MNAARCFTGTHVTVRFTTERVVTSGSHREACFELGGVKVEKDIVTFNEEGDEDVIVEEGPQIERARCCTGTHATVRFTKGTFVTSGSRVKFVLTWAMSKWRKTS